VSDGYSTEDAILSAKLAILQGQGLAKHTEQWLLCADRWLNLANFISKVNREELWAS
jgi:hypothetical protein